VAEGADVAAPKKDKWSQHVTETSDALSLEPEVFTRDDPAAIAQSLKESAETSTRRKSEPFRSAMSMLTFYINRAGNHLPEHRKRILEKAKNELRRLYGRRPR
jgi:phosphoenolpyruvate carboxylase